MLPFGEVILTTADKALWESLFDLKLEGVKAKPMLSKSFTEEEVFRAVIFISSNLAVSVFGNWLYDHFIRHPESEAQIERQHVSKDCPEITNIIMQEITVNNNYRV